MSYSSGSRSPEPEETDAEFVTGNYDELKLEVARGKGDLLDATASRLVVGEKSQKRFKRALKKRYNSIFKHKAEKGTKKILVLAEKYNQ